MRVAVIGAAGNAGRRHGAAFREEGCEVVEVEKGDMGEPAADAYSVATPDHLHVDTIAVAFFLEKHVFCEKPISHVADTLEDIEGAFRRLSGVTFSCNLPLRFSRKLRDLDLSGIRYMGGMYGWGRKSKMSGWRGEIPNYSIVCGGGIHLVDLMMQRYNVAPTDILAIRKPDMICATFHLGPAICSLTVDFSYEGRHEVNLTYGSDKGYLPTTFDEPNDFRASIRAFLEDIKAGRPGNGMEAIAANRACLAIEEAAR